MNTYNFWTIGSVSYCIPIEGKDEVEAEEKFWDVITDISDNQEIRIKDWVIDEIVKWPVDFCKLTEEERNK